MGRYGKYRVYPRIEIAGGIASGKTTLARLLAGAGLRHALECFRINPFWKAFYSEPKRYSFETETTFLLQHYHGIKTLPKDQRMAVCDFSLLLDRAYADLNLRGKQSRIFADVYSYVLEELKYPCLLVHLRCDARTELGRIRRRGRRAEQPIEVDYLAALNRAVERRVAGFRKHVRVLTINSDERDFAHHRVERKRVKTEVIGALEACRER